MDVEQQRQGSLQPLHQQQHELAQPLPIFHDGWPDSSDSDLYASAMETHRLFMRGEQQQAGWLCHAHYVAPLRTPHVAAARLLVGRVHGLGAKVTITVQSPSCRPAAASPHLRPTASQR